MLRFNGVKSFALDEITGGHVNLYGISYLIAGGHYHFDFTDEFQTSVVEMQNTSSFYVMSEAFSYDVINSQA